MNKNYQIVVSANINKKSKSHRISKDLPLGGVITDCGLIFTQWRFSDSYQKKCKRCFYHNK